MRRRLGGRQPLCGTGVTSAIDTIFNPSALSARTADSRPGPGPLMRTSRFFTPCSWAARPADSAATCAANGVDLREPLKPAAPDVAHDRALPCRSVIVMIVLLKDACTCAIPSETTFFTFLRTRAAAGALAMNFLPSRLNRRGLAQADGLARPLAGARIGARALTAHGQAFLVAHAPVTTEVHEPLDVHRRLAAQVPLDGELGNLLAQLVHLGVGKVLDLRGVLHPGRVADLARARTAHAEDRRQRDRRMLVIRNVDACNTCHERSLSLPLLVARIRADHANHAFAPHDLAFAADFLDRGLHSHRCLLTSRGT